MLQDEFTCLPCRLQGLPPKWLKTRLEMPCQWVMAACKAIGTETDQISVALHFLEIIQSAQRDLTHPERTTRLIDRSYSDSFCLSVPFLFLFFLSSVLSLSEIPKPAHPGGHGCRCLPGRHQETHTSVYCKSSRTNNTVHKMQDTSRCHILYLLSQTSPLLSFSSSLDQMVTTLPLTPTDMCCFILTSSLW